MGFMKSYFQPSKQAVELRETPTMSSHAFATSRAKLEPFIPIAPVAPIIGREALQSREGVRRKVEDLRSNYLAAVESGLPPPISVSTSIEPSSTSQTESSHTSHSRMSSPPDTASLSPTRQSVEQGPLKIFERPSRAMLQPQLPVDNRPSHQGAAYPRRDFRNNSNPDLGDMKTEIMCIYLHQQQVKNMWSNGGRDEGVLLKKARNEYHCSPPALEQEQGGIFDAVRGLNVRVRDEILNCVFQTNLVVCDDREYAVGSTVPTTATRHSVRPPRQRIASASIT